MEHIKKYVVFICYFTEVGTIPRMSARKKYYWYRIEINVTEEENIWVDLVSVVLG
jgi:hypothetical protein